MSNPARLPTPRLRRSFGVVGATLVGLTALLSMAFLSVGSSMAAPLNPVDVEIDVPPIVQEPEVDLDTVTPFDDHQDDQNLTFPDPDDIAPEAFEIGGPRDPFRQVVVPAPPRSVANNNAGQNDDNGAAGRNDDNGAAGQNDDNGAAGQNDDNGAAGRNDDNGAAGRNDDNGAAGRNDDNGAAGRNDDNSAAGQNNDNSGAGSGSSRTPALAATGFETWSSAILALISLVAGGALLSRTRR